MSDDVLVLRTDVQLAALAAAHELAGLEAEATALVRDIAHPDADPVALVPRLARLRDGIRAVRDSL